MGYNWHKVGCGVDEIDSADLGRRQRGLVGTYQAPSTLFYERSHICWYGLLLKKADRVGRRIVSLDG